MGTEIRPGMQATFSYLVLLLLVWALLQWLILPAWSGATDARAALLGHTVRNTQLLDTLAALEASAAMEPVAATADFGPERLGFTASTAALAGAQLQSLVRELASSHGITLTASATLRPDDAADSASLRVNVRFRCSLASLAAFLHALETHEQALHTENLVVQSRHRQGRTLGVASEELDVRMDVTSFLQDGGAG